jgi:threonine aldolase
VSAVIDFRSDTVTRPCPEMLRAMATAEVGDDVFGDDPTVNKLESSLAQRAGKDAGLFCTSGTQSNLVALLGHCQRGDEYIVGQEAHTYKYEGGGAAVLGSIQPQPLEYEADSTLDLGKVLAKIKDDDFHYARSRLLCLENTRSGEVLPLDYHSRAAQFCAENKLALHLDGARLFNAVIKQGVDLQDITRHYDSVSLCLSKGLGAPVGSVLVGSKPLIDEARRWRKMLGGGMRQAGILAAAGLYALDNNVERLAEDHRNAILLAQGLAELPGIHCDASAVQTNMLFIIIEGDQRASALTAHLLSKGILITGGTVMRLVTHRDISRDNISSTIAECDQFLANYVEQTP